MDFVLKPLGLFARQVYCIGRNYAEHAAELGNAVPPQPIVFVKPTSSLVHSGYRIARPADVQEMDHEVELVVAIGGSGRNLAESTALDFVAGYGIGIDVTARDRQRAAKEKGLPWLLAKGADTFAPVSDFVPRAEVGDGPFSFSLFVNGEPRQKGSTSQMVFPVARLVSFLSSHFTLNPGDLIFTGTPSGVGPLVPGDRVVATLEGTPARLEMEVV